MKRILTAFLIFLSCAAVDLGAQTQETQEKKTKETEKNLHGHQIFVKLGLVRTESKIESFRSAVNGISVDLETYFNKRHFWLSGWSVGYKKDDIQFSNFGHLINGSVFGTVGVGVADIKFSGGVEWGMPSANFNKTRFHYGESGLMSYEHLFLQKNSNIPELEPSEDALLYPFAEIVLLKKGKRFLVEAGIRGNIQKFGLDSYFLNGDDLIFVSSSKTIIVPSVFIKFGVALSGFR
ncbi:MAG: hypothetical protein A2750_00395 [Candidatus Yanofskybacteria bacterium RIFCSPHIGHO2_01_FULL_45_42]|uniref:DUF3575 domain-containing protein n=2 Tax=Candidatus Yanofskyibacteriota TaxID=1752733 RepID=A0A1F8FRZ1_9BACT|nr:MAG: hypothetical protein A2750_00395 [Candidatus Yanofskybacteria bacterium RIFCSPHIGHO2_01_FULL_45_42]OGN15954.1 MAG: hypothetical protein A3J47_01660 [Candidatus Yanofskybacteria bacterium RIFCSPHIGHO2_02_FULL_43_22]